VSRATPNVESDVFIVGPVRSGTSWLQTMLAEHPTLASPPESHLFANYLGPLEDSWRNDRSRVAAALAEPGALVGHGLATVMSDDEFTEQLRSFYDSVRKLVLAAKPGASRLLEKTPDHARWIDTIFRVAPDASIVFIVRDPRDTVRSLLGARGERWGYWVPQSLKDATTLWLTNVRPYFRVKRDPRVVLIRYEDLRADVAEFERVAKFLGLEQPARWLTTSIDAAPSARTSTVVRGDAARHDLNPYDAASFSYHDRTASRHLTDYEAAYVVMRCRDEMKALGYSTELDTIPARMRVERGARAIRVKSALLWRQFRHG
jgi:hypothetical protein